MSHNKIEWTPVRSGLTAYAGSKVHELKITARWFLGVRRGLKTAEVRIDDRNFAVGDVLVLKEWNTKTCKFTGKSLRRTITDITRLEDLISEMASPWVVLHMGGPDGLLREKK